MICSIIYKLIIICDNRSIIPTILFNTIQTTTILCLITFKPIITNINHLYFLHINNCRIIDSSIIDELITRYIHQRINNTI